ncbi:MAG: tRNA (adenosine(37)-N6)-dimethylallyltransferase MiaA [Lachnospiraceae bacterium]|nr:tRNA (adenosine(37)-N6)-dimethylallyltransferase MiaA [Lachnospiraceae bacterium]
MNKKPLVILTGPTAAGKTALSIGLAKRINGAIISADSMQVYRHMDIGSAKVTPEEMDGVPHYLIDVLEPSEEFSVHTFKQMAEAALEDIYEKGMIPIVVGGTGFYIQALLYDIQFTDTDTDTEYREKMEKLAESNGADWLHEQLRAVDPEAAEQIHANNVKRVIRALEYFHQTGQKISEHNETERQRTSPYNYVYFVLNRDRAELYRRIDYRVDKMLERGLLDEVKALKEMGYTRDMVAMKGLGYKEVLDYFSGEITLEEAIYRVKRDSRHFAKRQLTWFRRERDVTWVDLDGRGEDDVLEDLLDLLRLKGITKQ